MVTNGERARLTARLAPRDSGRVIGHVPWRAVLAGGLAFSSFAGLMSYMFTLATGRALWTNEADPSASFTYVFVMNHIYWNSWAVLTPAIFRVAERLPITPKQWVRRIGLHVVIGSSFVLLHSVMAGTGRVWLQTWFGMDPPWATSVRDHVLRTYDWELTYYAAAAGVWHAWHYRQEAARRASEAAGLELALVRAQLLALERQLHPHFLFNTLHAISALVRKRPDAAEEMIERLGELLRLTLRRDEAHEVPLFEELQYLELYLSIERVHFGARLRVTIDVAPDAAMVPVPRLLLQPLVENAVRHGIAPRESGGSVWVRGRLHGSQLVLTVEDDGVGLSSDGRRRLYEGVGTRNVRARLERLHGRAQSLRFAARSGGGLVVTIVLGAADAPGVADLQPALANQTT
jgi:signal transduction histidine kinase